MSILHRVGCEVYVFVKRVSDLQEQLDVREQHHKEGKRKAEERIKALEKK